MALYLSATNLQTHLLDPAFFSHWDHVIPIIWSLENPLQSLLAGGFKPSEKYEFANWDDYSIPNIFWENNPVMFQSPQPD